MLMRNPEYRHFAAQEFDQPTEVHSQAYSPAESLTGHIVLILLFVTAILLRSLT